MRKIIDKNIHFPSVILILTIILFFVLLFVGCNKENDIFPTDDVKLEITVDSLGCFSKLQSNLVVDDYLIVFYSVKNLSEKKCSFYKIKFWCESNLGDIKLFGFDQSYCNISKDSIFNNKLLIEIPTVVQEYSVNVLDYVSY